MAVMLAMLLTNVTIVLADTSDVKGPEAVVVRFGWRASRRA
jgi:hypothetical protein